MDARRLALEVGLLSKVSNGTFARSGETIFFTETIRVGANDFTFRITFPERYPLAAPRVHLVSPKLEPSAEVHMFVDGGLCLHGSSEWHPRNTGIWIRNRAVGWIAALITFCDTGAWPNI